MNFSRVAYAFMFLSATLLAPQFASAQLQTEATNPTPIIIGESWTIESEALGATRTYNVWLPPSYATSDERYPVLYVIDGGLEQDFHHISGLAQLGSVAAMFREVIVVGIETKDRQSELTYRSDDAEHIKEFPTHGHSDSFRAFIRDEVMTKVNARYRTSGEDALIGESLAGLFIAETFLKAPDTADIYIAISPSMWWDRESLGKGSRADLKAMQASERKLYLTIANEGGMMRRGVLALVTALKAEKAPGLAWTFSDRPDLEHSTIYHREALEALVWAFKKDDE